MTRLDTGNPVPKAEVIVTNYCENVELWRGVTDANGLAQIDKSIGIPTNGDSCQYGPPPVMVTASALEDFSFTMSTWNEGIEPYSFGVPVGNERSADMAHTVLDRPLFRAGETVSMKHFLRRHVKDGITIPEGTAGKYVVTVSHNASGQVYTNDVQFGADGIAEQTWKIPSDAKLGAYVITIAAPDRKRNWQTGDFKIEEFRLPTMRASVQGKSGTLVRPKDATLDLHVSYLSGGSASNLPVKVRTVVEPWTLRYPEYENYRFGGETVKEGLQISEGSWWDFDAESEEPQQSAKASVMPLTLDAQGAARVTVPNLPAINESSMLTAELEYADANGELLTTSGRIRLVPSELTVGIRTDGWVSTQDLARFRVLVLDLNGKPVGNTPVNVSMFTSVNYSYRKRLIGGFYTYESAKENTRIAPKCEGKTNPQGLVLCSVAPGVSGQVLLRAEARDSGGNVAGATTSIWVAGNDDWWFGGTAADRMDVLPENPEYEAGDVARFQVRMPFRTARALVTVEREGVMRSFVTTLSGREPVVKVPVQAVDSPNVYVSVLALRGRVGKASRWRKVDDSKEITALVDLNKPAYRMGIGRIRRGARSVPPEHQLGGLLDHAEQLLLARERVAPRGRRDPVPAGRRARRVSGPISTSMEQHRGAGERDQGAGAGAPDRPGRGSDEHESTRRS